MRSVSVAVVVLYDRSQNTYAIVRSDHLHPVPDLRYKYKGIGGVVEEGEDPESAVRREIQEEFPGVWDANALQLTALPLVDGGYSFPENEPWTHWQWIPFLAEADLSKQTYRKARSVATESNLYIFPFSIIPMEEECMQGFQDVICSAIRVAYSRVPQGMK